MKPDNDNHQPTGEYFVAFLPPIFQRLTQKPEYAGIINDLLLAADFTPLRTLQGDTLKVVETP